MHPQPWVGVFVEMRAVEAGQRVLVVREMRRYPVENHADAALVQVVDEVHQILRVAETRCRREIARDLIAPRSVERMLHDRHQLDVREAATLDVSGEPWRNRAIAHLPEVRPRTEV